MSSMLSDLKTEGLAKKLAQSNNQKCNFKYLMNNKTNRYSKASHPSKENQIQSVIMDSAHKLANKASKYGKCDSQILDNTRMPLCLQSATLINTIESHEQLGLPKQKNQKWPQIYSHISGTANLQKQEEQQFSITDLELQSKIKTDASQMSSQSIACMTDECYYEKELLIKMELLKKQRDEIWNSISDIVKQNITLKQIVAQFTIDSKTIQTAFVQTQTLQQIEIQAQTDLQGSQIDNQYQNYLKSKKDLQEAQSLCLKVLPKEGAQNYSNNIALKDLLLETLNLNLSNISSQFQKQKQFLLSLNNQQIEQWKKTVDKLKIDLKKSNQKLEENIRLKDNIKKLYQKEIQELKSLVQQKQINFINQILQIKEDWQDIITTHDIRNKFYLEYFENTKDCFKEKQKMYTTLLSQSHKTIHNLMSQMKQFQAMANSNYYKHLRSQRSQHKIETNPKTLE